MTVCIAANNLSGTGVEGASHRMLAGTDRSGSNLRGIQDAGTSCAATDAKSEAGALTRS
jgi:hypothetical protein